MMARRGLRPAAAVLGIALGLVSPARGGALRRLRAAIRAFRDGGDPPAPRATHGEPQRPLVTPRAGLSHRPAALGEVLLDHARSLPYRVQREYVSHMRSQYPQSQAHTLDDLVAEGLLTPERIAQSFWLERRTPQVEPIDRDRARVSLVVYNGGTNTNSTLRPGISEDWIGFIAADYARQLEQLGAQIQRTEVLDSRNFELSFTLPTSQLPAIQRDWW
jgi:hypothetical protein